MGCPAFLRVLVVGVLVAAATGCAGPGAAPAPPLAQAPVPQPSSGRPYIGVLRVLAGTVTLNGAPAADGVRVYDGDKIATGPASGALLEAAGRGSVQFDQNTDPIIRLMGSEGCALVRVLFGQVFLKGPNLCAVDANGVEQMVSGSVNLAVSGPTSTITVVEGSARVLRPVIAVVEKGQQLTVEGTIVRGPVALPEPQVAAVIAWLSRVPAPR